jgi:hypothetical protein
MPLMKFMKIGGKLTMKTKIYSAIRFMLLLVFLAGLITTGFGQENTLQGTWFDYDRFFHLTFYNGLYEEVLSGRPYAKGEYTVAGDKIIIRLMYIHSNAIDDYRDRWFSREETVAEFGRFDSWFEPVTQVFSIDGDILTIVDEFSVQRFERVR